MFTRGRVYFTFPFPNAVFIGGGVYKRAALKTGNTVTVCDDCNACNDMKVLFLVDAIYLTAFK